MFSFNKKQKDLPKKRKKSKAVACVFLCALFSLSLFSCIRLEGGRSGVSQPAFSFPFSDISAPENPNQSQIQSVPEETGEPSHGSREESVPQSQPPETSQPAPAQGYDYGNFYVKGFDVSQISALAASLAQIIDASGATVGIYYEELETGNFLSYNKDHKFCSGSVIKAPYAAYLLNGGGDLSEKLALSAFQKTDGSGKLKDALPGTEYTVEKLIEYAVVASDNTAYRMLYDRFGFDGFTIYTYMLGVETGCSSDGLGYLGFMSAFEAGILFKEIYRRSLGDAGFSRLMGYLKNAEYPYLLPAGISNHPVAHKYGYMTGAYKVLHDAGVVLDDAPYVIAILTDFDPSGGNGRGTFREISAAINAFHDHLEG